MAATVLDLQGVKIHKGLLDPAAQEALLEEVRAITRAAPLMQPRMPSGRPMSVRMTSAGRCGWVAGPGGYRYAARHPEGMIWPAVPEGILAIWRAVSGVQRDPDSCLVNFYGEGARMGLHQDKDEGDFAWPVVSVSLGDAALFRVGGIARKDPSRSAWLESGDVAVIGGDARLAYHGIDRIKFGSSRLLPKGGRINLTLRVVTAPVSPS